MKHEGRKTWEEVNRLITILGNVNMAVDGRMKLVDSVDGMSFYNEDVHNSKDIRHYMIREKSHMDIYRLLVAMDKSDGKTAEGNCKVLFEQISKDKYYVKIEVGETCKDDCINHKECARYRNFSGKMIKRDEDEAATTGPGRAKAKGA